MALIVGGTTVTGTQTLDATKLTGNLPEISGADLTNLPAPTTAAVGTATAGFSAGDVGSYGFMRDLAAPNSGASPGGNVPASQLKWMNAHGGNEGSPSGTWKRLGRPIGGVSPEGYQAIVCLRIS
tara:strand:- start:1777 stop:2151 length:375 start_codon:yes stop_codon:yes gene_type:complete